MDYRVHIPAAGLERAKRLAEKRKAAAAAAAAAPADPAAGKEGNAVGAAAEAKDASSLAAPGADAAAVPAAAAGAAAPEPGAGGKQCRQESAPANNGPPGGANTEDEPVLAGAALADRARVSCEDLQHAKAEGPGSAVGKAESELGGSPEVAMEGPAKGVGKRGRGRQSARRGRQRRQRRA